MLDPNAEPDHYDLSPSSAYRWIYCPGSIHELRDLRRRGILQEDDEGDLAARVGTYGHNIMEGFVGGYKVPRDPVLDELDPDQEKLFWRLVADCIRDLPGKTKDECEEHLELKIKSAVVPNHGGTMDIARWYPRFRHIHVLDYKFGHQAVEIEGNDQIQCYLNLARERWPEAEVFTGTIVQPSYRGAITTQFTKRELDIQRVRVQQAAQSTYKEADTTRCKYCPLAVYGCDHFNAMVHKTAQQFDDLLGEELKKPKQVYELPSEEDLRKVEDAVALYRVCTKAMEDASKLLKQRQANGVELKKHRVQTINSQKLTTSHSALDKSDIPLHVYTRLNTITDIRKKLKLSKSDFAKRYPQLVTEIQSTRLVASTQVTLGDFDFED